MSYKLKHDSIDVFCKEVTSEICDEFFKVNDVAGGSQLSSLTGSKQCNLLLIKRLFEKWQAETSKLESPYFDFEQAEVQEALSAFMNVLSKHMSVARPDLEPLLESALHDSVLLHFDSLTFYTDRLVAEMDKVIEIEVLQGLKRYLKVNANPFNDAVDAIQKDAITKKNLVKSLNSALSKAELEVASVEEFLNELDASDKLNLLFEEELPIEQEVEQSIEEEEIEEQVEIEPVSVESNGLEESGALNEKYSKSSKTLADELQKKVKKDIESSLGVNEKIMFINSLFGGNKDDFKSALKDIESSTSLADARSKVESNYGTGWDMETEEAEAFIEVLERRFA